MNNQKIPDRHKLEQKYRTLLPLFEATIQDITGKLRQTFYSQGPGVSFKYRVKNIDSYFNKLLRRLRDTEIKDPFNITDILGIRIICPFIDDTEKAREIVTRNFKVLEAERKGLQRTFREFGYEATHLIIEIDYYEKPRGNPLVPTVCEIQISTTLQDAWSEVEHELVYKSGLTPFDTPLKRKLAALNATLTLSDTIFQEIRDYHRSIHEHTEKRRDNLYTHQMNGTGEVADNKDSPLTSEETLPSSEGLPEDSIDNRLLKALTAHNEGNFSKAIELYTGLLKNEPSGPIRSVILNHRGIAHMADSDYEKAITDFNEALTIDPENFRSLNYIAMCFRMTGEYDSAISRLDRSLALNPYQAENYYSRALIYFDLGDYQMAMEHCKNALNFKPENQVFIKFSDLVKKKLYRHF